jgi:hypothetical protein
MLIDGSARERILDGRDRPGTVRVSIGTSRATGESVDVDVEDGHDGSLRAVSIHVHPVTVGAGAHEHLDDREFM